ncbi:MAG TPA: protein kinase [Pseudogracilibacillus sp.]|nr:protein kinase [Pseudogracilibacillus sp.]
MIDVNTAARKRDIRLRRGTNIRGKWHHKVYTVVRLLGSGTVGDVYLCRSQGQAVAVKISEQALSMTAEVQALKILQTSKVQDSGLGPSLLDVDDWQVSPGKIYSFYVMEYVAGLSLHSFVKRQGTIYIGILLCQMLKQLEELHKIGYVFGDLKSENIIVTDKPVKIRLIDVGGMTKIGRSVKEYTNFYDRAYWRLGKRLAEPSYDLFAVTMVTLAIFYPGKFLRVEHNGPFLRRKIKEIKSLRLYAPVLEGALRAAYPSAKAMQDALLKRKQASPSQKGRPAKKSSLVEIVLLATCASLYYGIYLVLTIGL